MTQADWSYAVCDVAGSSAVPTTRMLRLTSPTVTRSPIVTPSASIVLGAKAISSSPAGAEPSSTVGSNPPSVATPKTGVVVPLIGIARAHVARKLPLTAGSLVTFAMLVVGEQPGSRELVVPDDPGSCRIIDRVGETVAEGQAGDNGQHAGHRTDERRPDRHRASAATDLDGEPRSDHHRRR